MTKSLDSIDHKILRMLARDGRRSCTDMAYELDLATSTIHNRLERLRKNGVIEQFTILADPNVLGLRVTAFLGVNLDPSLKREDRTRIIKEICERKGVLEVHELLEPYDLLLKTRARDINTLKDRIIRPLNNLKGVSDSISLLTTKRHKELTLDEDEVEDGG